MNAHLPIYLNDHLSGSLGGIKLCERCSEANRGSDLGLYLENLAAELKEDQEYLRTVMDALGVSENPLKAAVAWTAEKLGRLKSNGQLAGYSPLSRVIELEALLSGSRARLALWEALREVSTFEPIVELAKVQELIERVRVQLEDLERHRRQALRIAFLGSGVDRAPETSHNVQSA